MTIIFFKSGKKVKNVWKQCLFSQTPSPPEIVWFVHSCKCDIYGRPLREIDELKVARDPILGIEKVGQHLTKYMDYHQIKKVII